MGTIKITAYDEATVQLKNVYGKQLGGHEDATTSTSLETYTIPGGALVLSVTAMTGDHYININSTAASTASNREVVLEGQTKDFEIPLGRRGGAAKASYRLVS